MTGRAGETQKAKTNISDDEKKKGEPVLKAKPGSGEGTRNGNGKGGVA